VPTGDTGLIFVIKTRDFFGIAIYEKIIGCKELLGIQIEAAKHDNTRNHKNYSFHDNDLYTRINDLEQLKNIIRHEDTNY